MNLVLPTREEIEKVKLGLEVQRLSALLTAILVKTGKVTLSEKEASAVYKDATLHYERDDLKKEMSVWVTYKGLDKEAMRPVE